MMRHLDAALPAARRGAWAADSKSLAPLVLAALADGDVVLVKGSLGSAMRHVIEALDQAAAAVRVSRRLVPPLGRGGLRPCSIIFSFPWPSSSRSSTSFATSPSGAAGR